MSRTRCLVYAGFAVFFCWSVYSGGMQWPLALIAMIMVPAWDRAIQLLRNYDKI
jgi:hypothetical protein